MKIIFDKQADMLNIQLSEEPSVESSEIEPGLVVDFDKNGTVVNIEIENASKMDLSKISFENLGNVS